MNFLTEYYDFLQEGILGIDDARKICYANPAAQRILHLSPEQLNGTDLGRIFPEAPAGTEKLTLPYQARTLEFCRYGDVSAAWPEMAVKFIRRPEKKAVVGIMSFLEAAPGRTIMADENAMFNAVLDNIPCQVFIKDPRDGFRYKIANRNFTDYYHRSPSEVVDRNDYELFEREVANQLRGHDRKVCATPGEVYRFDEDISFGRTGNEVFKSLKVCFETAQGHPYLLGVCVDVTDFHTVQRRLSEAVEKIKRVSQTRNYFFSTMSHELRTPLNAIIGFSELQQDSSFSTDELADYAKEINLSGKALLTLLNDILELTKSETDQLPVQLEPLDLKNFCNSICSVFHYRTLEKGLTLELDCPDDLPLFLLGERHLRQVLLNLLGNAVKFTTRGGITVTVASKALDAKHAALSIAVADTGCGINPEFLPKIFAPFEREGEITPEKRGIPGAGLGLPIARRLMDRLGGRLKVDSHDGVGSTFTLEIDAVATLPRQ